MCGMIAEVRAATADTQLSWSDRLGFACIVMGKDGIKKAADGRRPQNDPHLRHSLEGLLETIEYCSEVGIRMYRIPSGLVPYATHPDHPRFWWEKQLSEASDEVAAVRAAVERTGIRLSFHPSQFVVLNSPKDDVVSNAVEELRWQAAMLDEFGCGPESVSLIHVGGVYGEREAAADRMVSKIAELRNSDPTVVRRLALENDDVSWCAKDTYDICTEAGVPMIFDTHHHSCLNSGEDWVTALSRALKTWPRDVRPKIHMSSPRLQARDDGSAPPLRAHSDFIDPLMFARFTDTCDDLGFRQFDIMLEAKAKDLALLELRKTIGTLGYAGP